MNTWTDPGVPRGSGVLSNDVIDGSWELNALFAWHDPMMAESVGWGNR